MSKDNELDDTLCAWCGKLLNNHRFYVNNDLVCASCHWGYIVDKDKVNKLRGVKSDNELQRI